MVGAACWDNEGVIGMGQQIRYTAAFKQATITEMVAREKRLMQICRERRIDETRLRRWRQEYDERGAVAWVAPAPGVPRADERLPERQRVIGQRRVENLAVKQAWQAARSLSARGLLSSGA